MLRISKQSDYGLLILTYLKGKDHLVPLSELVEKLKLPKRFIARIAANLVASGFLVSKEGKSGGYQLSSKIKKVSLFDFLKIFESNLNLTRCEEDNYRCPWEDHCSHKSLFKDKLRKIFIKQLKNYQLSKII